MKRASVALGDAMASTGMAEHPMLAALETRDVAAVAERRRKLQVAPLGERRGPMTP